MNSIRSDRGNAPRSSSTDHLSAGSVPRTVDRAAGHSVHTRNRTTVRSSRRTGALSGLRDWFSDADHRYSALRRILLAVLILYTLLIVRSTTTRDVDFESISSSMLSAPGIDLLESIDANGFQDRLGISPEGCEGWLLYGSSDIMNVSEMMIAKASDANVRETLEAACADRLSAQLDVFRNYGVDQAALLDYAILWQRGDYVFYGVSENVDRWEELFLSRIR